jgi:hypothetical protein
MRFTMRSAAALPIDLFTPVAVSMAASNPPLRRLCHNPQNGSFLMTGNIATLRGQRKFTCGGRGRTIHAAALHIRSIIA